MCRLMREREARRGLLAPEILARLIRKPEISTGPPTQASLERDMKVKTAELTGPALAHVVAIALGGRVTTVGRKSHLGSVEIEVYEIPGLMGGQLYLTRKGEQSGNNPMFGFSAWRPDLIWSQGGQLIERYKIDVFKAPSNFIEKWAAYCKSPMQQGPTPLIAAMRAIVATKFGDAVEVPDELLA